MMAAPYDQNTLMTIAQNLPDMERQILQALKEKGVGLALDVAVRDGRVKPGQTLLLEAFGGGFAWGSALLRF